MRATHALPYRSVGPEAYLGSTPSSMICLSGNHGSPDYFREKFVEVNVYVLFIMLPRGGGLPHIHLTPYTRPNVTQCGTSIPINVESLLFLKV